MAMENLKKKIKYGDYNTLGEMLNVPPTTAKARFFREDKEATEALALIIASREKMIHDFQNK